MPWKTLSLHFKQTYDGGYRYLDKCGEFMLAAAEALNVIPGDIKPSGAKMEIPEKVSMPPAIPQPSPPCRNFQWRMRKTFSIQ
jgi:hypothetical protein